MCNKSESITELAKALAMFNMEVPKIGKNATNPHFKNRYATLDNIIDEIKPLLSKHGLSIIQMPGGDGEKFTMTTLLVHTSGEWIESPPLVMRPAKNDPQGIGSCSTYAMRYGICAFLGLSTGEDDDGNIASQSQPSAKLNPNSKLPKLIGEIKTEWSKKGFQLNQLDAQSTKLYGAKLTSLTEEQAQDFIDKLTGKKEAV